MAVNFEWEDMSPDKMAALFQEEHGGNAIVMKNDVRFSFSIKSTSEGRFRNPLLLFPKRSGGGVTANLFFGKAKYTPLAEHAAMVLETPSRTYGTFKFHLGDGTSASLPVAARADLGEGVYRAVEYKTSPGSLNIQPESSEVEIIVRRKVMRR